MAGEKKQNTSRIGPVLLILFVVAFFWLLSDVRQFRASSEAIPYSQFLEAVKAGRVAEVTVGKDTIEGQFKHGPKEPPKIFSTTRVDDAALVNQLSQQG